MGYLSALLIGAFAVPLTCAVARAEGASETSRAALLFAEGRRLMAAGDYAAACPKFAESLTLDQQADTALDLSTCYKRASQQALAIARSLAPVAVRDERGDTSSEEGTESSESESPGRAQRLTGLVLGGVGVAGVVGGVIAAIAAKSKLDQMTASCGTTGTCLATQLNSVHNLAVAGDVSLVAGLAAVAAGAIVFFTAPKDPTVLRPSIGVAPTAHGAEVSVGAVF